MNILFKICNLSLVYVCVFVALIRRGICAPSSLTSEYVHNPFVSSKEKRSADLLDILSNMLLEHSSGVDETWPDFGSIFNNDLSSYEDYLSDNDFVSRYLDFNDRNVNLGILENIEPHTIDYSCSEEENNEIVPFVDSGYHYHKRPENTNEEDFIVIKPGVEYAHRNIHEYDWGYAVNDGSMKSDWNQIPLREADEIDETLWKQHSQSTPIIDVNRGIPGDSYQPRGNGGTQKTKTYGFDKEAKFNIFTCFSGPPEEETKNIADDYLVLLIKKDHLLGGKEGNQTKAINPPQPETSFTENVAVATSTMPTPTTVQLTSTERATISKETTTVNNLLGSATEPTSLKADDSNKATTQSSYSFTLGSVRIPTTIKVDDESFNFVAATQNSTSSTFASVNLPTTLHIPYRDVSSITTTQSPTSPKLSRTTLPTTFAGSGEDSKPTLGSVELTTTLKAGGRNTISTTPTQRTSSPSFGSVELTTTMQAGVEDTSSTTTVQSSSSSIQGRTTLPTMFQKDFSPLVTTQSSISSTFGSVNLLTTIQAGDRHTGSTTTTQSYPSTALGSSRTTLHTDDKDADGATTTQSSLLSTATIPDDTFSFNSTNEEPSSPSKNVSKIAINANLTPIPFTTSIYTAIGTLATTTQGFKLSNTESPVLSASHIPVSTFPAMTQGPKQSYSTPKLLLNKVTPLTASNILTRTIAATTQRSISSTDKVPDSITSTINDPSSSTFYTTNSNVVTIGTVATKSPDLFASHISTRTIAATTQRSISSTNKVPDSITSTINDPSSSTSYTTNSNVVTNSSQISTSETSIQSLTPSATEIYPSSTRSTPYISLTESVTIVDDPKSDKEVDLTQVPKESTNPVTTSPPYTNTATISPEDISNSVVTNLTTMEIQPTTGYKTSSDSSKYVTSTTERTASVTTHNGYSTIQPKELVILANIQPTTNPPFASPNTRSEAINLKDETTTFGTVTPDLWTLIE